MAPISHNACAGKRRRVRSPRRLAAVASLAALSACADIADALWPPIQALPGTAAPAAATPGAATSGAAQTPGGALVAQARAYRQRIDALTDRIGAGAPEPEAVMQQAWTRAGSELDIFAAQLARLAAGGSSQLLTHGQAFLACERDRLTVLGSAIGNRGGERSQFARLPIAPSRPSGRPYVTIRFDRPSPAYEEALFIAVNEAIERKPDVRFDLEPAAASGSAGEAAAIAEQAASCQAEKVRRGLITMGLAPQRISLAPSASARPSANEVRIYLR